MKKIDLRGFDPLKPKHLIETERGLMIGCEEMSHLEEDLYKCTDSDACGIVYGHLEFVGYPTREPKGDVDRMFPPEVDHAPMRCDPRCDILKRNSVCNFICAQCGGYWYLKPGQKFLATLDDLHNQDKRVIKFLLTKLRESVESVKGLSAEEWRKRNWLKESPKEAAQMKTYFTERLESLLSALLQRYEI